MTAESNVTRADADEYLGAVAGGGALTYRKPVDGRADTIAMGHDDLMAIGVRVRSFHDSPVGALAIVLSQGKSEPVARVLGILASADRPIRLFTSLPPARRWLESLVPPPSGEDAGRIPPA